MTTSVQPRSVIGATDDVIINELTQFSISMADVQRQFNDHLPTNSRGQGKVLAILEATPRMTQKELVPRLNISPASASELINKLAQKQFIRRTRSRYDRRVVEIELTAAGRAELARYKERFAAILVDLTEEERANFVAVIRKLVSSVKSQLSHG
jgi:DNA-binding MarR family transcriptional regulator